MQQCVDLTLTIIGTIRPYEQEYILMATGTGNLPNPSMSFSPFAILTAEQMNNLVSNINSLATGTGIGDGAVTSEKLSSTIAFRATSTQSIANGAGAVNVTAYTEVFDTGGDFNHTTGIFTAPLTGIYQLNAASAYTDITQNARMGLAISVISVGNIAEGFSTSGAANHDPAQSASVTCKLTASQTVRVTVFQDSGGAQALRTPSGFSGFFVGTA